LIRLLSYRYIQLQCSSRAVRVFGELLQASGDIYDDSTHSDIDGCHGKNNGRAAFGTCSKQIKEGRFSTCSVTCSSLIAIVVREGHQMVQFAHFLVKEYLTAERLAMAEGHLPYYLILPEPVHTGLAHAGLSVLLQLDDKINRRSWSMYLILQGHTLCSCLRLAQLCNQSLSPLSGVGQLDIGTIILEIPTCKK